MFSLPQSTSRPTPTFQETLRGLKVQGRVISALVLRDAQTRYGQHKLGFVWLFLEPAFMVLLFILFKVFVRGTDGGTMNDAYFITTGIVPFLLFRQLMQVMAGSITGSLSLLAFPQVRTFDVLMATFIIEFITTLFVFGVMTCLLYTSPSPRDRG